MKPIIPAILICIVFFISCKEEPSYEIRNISSVEIESTYEDSLLSIRALDIDSEYVYYGSSDHIGKRALRGENKVDLTNLEWSTKKNHFKNFMTYENDTLNFRAISDVKGTVFAVSIGNPARLYKMYRKSNKPHLVYEEVGEKVFYDSMDFWNDDEGIAIGDSTDGCLSVIITRDGGETWKKLSCDDLPEGIDGEGAFAASDTNIAIVGNKTWVATTAGRIYYSPDKGKTWKVFDTPIVKEKETEGIYSIDFYDELNGFGIGGDYTKPDDNQANKIVTTDGGKTWELVPNGPGYRSCVQYIPNREGKELVAVGFKGIDYSNDSGSTWKHLSDEGFYTIRFVNENIAYAAGKGRISKLTFEE